MRLINWSPLRERCMKFTSYLQRVAEVFVSVKRNNMKIAGIILWIIAVVLLAVGGYMLVKEKLFLLGAQQATAVVTGNERHTYESSDYGTQHFYCSDFQVQTKDGASISFSEDDSTDVACTDLDMPPDYQIGQQVPVYYDPRDPAHTVQIPGQ